MMHESPRALLGTTILALLMVVGCQQPPELHDHGTLPPWSFTDERGQPIGSAELAGKPWAANFLFTSCQSSCPPLARSTKALQDRIRQWAPEGNAPARIVSITVDPVTDDQARLADFARTYEADPRIWKMARGSYPEMEELVVGGFMQPLNRRDLLGLKDDERIAQVNNPTPIDTAHSLRFVLVDGDGRIRNLYGQTEDDLDELNRALRHLASQEGGR